MLLADFCGRGLFLFSTDRDLLLALRSGQSVLSVTKLTM